MALVKSALAVRHVAFEDLGWFGPVLGHRGFAVRYHDAAAGFAGVDAQAPELVVVLGGPIGAYEEHLYPFLADEIALIRDRLERDQPTLGICLGAQLMARALGARVYPGEVKEIGWSPLTLTEDGMSSSLHPLAGPDLSVLHWHGDTFDLPPGATRLASSALYQNQAFAWGNAALALQFHAEATAEGLELWFVGHACEIAGVPQLSLPALRAESRWRAEALRQPAEAFLGDWLDRLGL
jgi:GMP synthase (glutamine-hydrolysing)